MNDDLDLKLTIGSIIKRTISNRNLILFVMSISLLMIGLSFSHQVPVVGESNYIINNTDLYGTERIQNTIYYTNNSSVQLFLIFHVVGTGSPIWVDTNITINGVVVYDQDYRTVNDSNIHEHISYFIEIPRFANYSVSNSTTVYQLEWREYYKKS